MQQATQTLSGLTPLQRASGIATKT